MSRSGAVKGSELAASMAAVIGDRLRKCGVDEHRADRIALEVLDEVRSQYGGQNVYFARDTQSKSSARDNEIFDRFDRNELTIPGIVEQYGISLQWAYQIIRKIRAARREEREAIAAKARELSQERWKREGGIGHDL
ncbi:MAG: Mor transcription activator family protein [Pseudomonas sp.]|uniref:Mor transcription activator family protein n=1 Tax=Pseudomonas sp. TaxID=306 RepID=UPI0027359F6D|nr:Mor transcription activator family protein [Pseudomonas sp.]MDP3848103.1 Mor transcription activator family protein [Pseudomonas sp.]